MFFCRNMKHKLCQWLNCKEKLGSTILQASRHWTWLTLNYKSENTHKTPPAKTSYLREKNRYLISCYSSSPWPSITITIFYQHSKLVCQHMFNLAHFITLLQQKLTTMKLKLQFLYRNSHGWYRKEKVLVFASSVKATMKSTLKSYILANNYANLV